MRIEVVDRLRALARVEHVRVIAGAADRDGGDALLREPPSPVLSAEILLKSGSPPISAVLCTSAIEEPRLSAPP